MIKGLYTAAAGMLAQTVATDTLADNLANISTTGFKRRDVTFQSFPQTLIRAMGDDGQSREIGSMLTGNCLHGTVVHFAQGILRETGNPLDIGIKGDGFFALRDTETNKTFYTRNGDFSLDAEGYVVNSEGMRLQGAEGDILMPPNTSQIDISEKGQIMANNEPLTVLDIAHFADNHELSRSGYTLFEASPQAQRIIPKAEPTIVQKALEQSNTNPVSELVHNITGMRLYEALQKSIHQQNETLQKVVNEVGRYR